MNGAFIIKTILLVEDEAISAMLEKSCLEKFGYNVLIADTGEKAIEMVDSNPGGIELVLMDINLGDGIDGTGAAEKILEKHELPLVFLSSHNEPDVVEKTDRITSYGYIVKNCDKTILNASIKMAFKLFEAKMKENKKNEALLESEKRYHNIFNNCVEGLFQTTPEGRYRTVNQAFARMFGFESPAEMIKTVTDIGGQLYVDPQDRRRLIALLNESKEGVVKDFEVELMRRDRTRFWISINCRMLYDAEKNAPYIEGSCLDVTDRRKAEAALRDSEFKYRMLIEYTNDVVFCTDRKGNYIFVNSAFASTFDRAPDYFYGKTLWDVYSKEQADIRFNAIGKVFETGEVGSVEVEVPLPDRTLSFLATLNPIKDERGNITSVLTHSRNITDRKLMENALKESESNLREVIETSIDNIFVVEVCPENKFRIKMINGALEKCMRLDRKDIEGKFLNDLLSVDLVDQISENYIHCAQSRKPCNYEEAADLYGVKTYYSTSLAPVFDETGKSVVRFIGISRNITEIKKAEEQIKNLLNEKDAIIREVHHRVKNNMNTIYGLLMIQVKTQSLDAARNVLQDAAGRVRSMTLLYDKLYRSEFTSGVSVKEYLPPLINEIVGVFRGNKSVKVETRIDDVILSAQILSPLGILINELICNSMKYAFEDRDGGGISVSLLKNSGGRISLTVADDGCGIPESVTFHNSSGLGLQLVEMLAEQLKGTAVIERGGGTKFVIEFDA